MAGIYDIKVLRKYHAAMELLSALDTHLESARLAIRAISWRKNRHKMRAAYEEMAAATNLHTAAKEALKQASVLLLDSDSVNTFFMLACHACMRSSTAMELAVGRRKQNPGLGARLLERVDFNDSLYYRDRLRSAWEDAERTTRSFM